jgi:hypothetical protein
MQLFPAAGTHDDLILPDLAYAFYTNGVESLVNQVLGTGKAELILSRSFLLR